MALLALLFVALTPAPTLAQDGDAESHYLQAIEFFNAGRYQEALDSFDRAIAVSPEAIFFCNRATVLMKLDEFQDALTSMETCLERFEATDPETQAERAQIHAEVQALRLAVRGVDPSGRAVATSIATRPKDTGGGGGGGSDIVFIEPIEPPGPTGLEIGAWTAASVAGLSLAGALTMELVTQPLIDEYRRIGSEGLDRSRYDALRAAIDQRKVVIGVLVVAGSVSALASGVLFWADAGSEEEPKGGAVGADIRLLEGGAAVEITVGF